MWLREDKKIARVATRLSISPPKCAGFCALQVCLDRFRRPRSAQSEKSGWKHGTEIARKLHAASGSLFHFFFAYALRDLVHHESFLGNVKPAKLGNDIVDDSFARQR